MKKLLSIILSVCVISTLLVMPAQAAGLSYTQYLDMRQVEIVSFGVDAGGRADASATPEVIAEYPISNVFDGDPSTAGVFNLLGRSKYWNGGSSGHEVSDVFLAGGVMLDLGQEYEIRGFETATTTSTVINDIKAKYPDRMNSISTTAQGMIYLCKGPTYNSDTDFRWNKYNAWSSGTNAIPAGEKYRYVYITALGSNQTGLALAEFYLKVAPPETGIKYSFFKGSTSDVPFYEYPMSNLFDGRTDTYASIASRRGANATGNSIWVIDLGEVKTLNGIKFRVPSDLTAAYKAVLGNAYTHTSPLAEICVSETEPAITAAGNNLADFADLTCISGERSDGRTMWMEAGTVKNKTFSTPKNVRYITIKQANTTYPVMLSEIELDEYVAPSHEHDWAEVWSSDDANHWKECTAEGCDVTENSAKEGYGAHVYDDKYDAYCNTCNYFRVAEPLPQPIEATFASSVAFGEADGVEALRFYFTPSFTDEITNFGAYIVPFALFDDEGEAITVKGNKAIESGKTFAADLVGIPVAAYDSTIVAVPFVVSTDDLYTYGSQVQTTVNANK